MSGGWKKHRVKYTSFELHGSDHHSFCYRFFCKTSISINKYSILCYYLSVGSGLRKVGLSFGLTEVPVFGSGVALGGTPASQPPLLASWLPMTAEEGARVL